VQPASGIADLVRRRGRRFATSSGGWQALTEPERADVQARVEAVLREHTWGPHAKDALLHLFTFLAQVETIAIEIRCASCRRRPKTCKPILRRQLVDEVFHSTIFARLAHELALPAAQPPRPLPSAETPASIASGTKRTWASPRRFSTWSPKAGSRRSSGTRCAGVSRTRLQGRPGRRGAPRRRRPRAT